MKTKIEGFNEMENVIETMSLQKMRCIELKRLQEKNAPFPKLCDVVLSLSALGQPYLLPKKKFYLFYFLL